MSMQSTSKLNQLLVSTRNFLEELEQSPHIGNFSNCVNQNSIDLALYRLQFDRQSTLNFVVWNLRASLKRLLTLTGLLL